MLTLDAFEEAAAKVKEVTQETKLIESPYFSEISRNRVFFKPENMQRTGAYKVRGAYYKISTLTDEETAHGADHRIRRQPRPGRRLRRPACTASSATIVMPTTTPLIKVERHQGLRRRGGAARQTSSTRPTSRAAEACRGEGPDLHPPLQRPDRGHRPGHHRLWRSSRSCRWWTSSWCPSAAAVWPRGVSTLAKLLNPNVKVIGVEPSGAACHEGQRWRPATWSRCPAPTPSPTASRCKTPGDKVFPYVQQNLDEIITVDDDELVDGLPGHGREAQDDRGELRPAHRGRPQAPGLQGQERGLHPLRRQHGRHHHVLSGAARPDPAGAASSPFSVLLPDRPGELVRVANVIARATTATSSSWSTTSSSPSTARPRVELRVTIEAFGTDHKRQIVKALEGEGFRPKLINAHL